MNWIVADDYVIPPDHQRFYSEQVLRLPGCYQPNDDRRPRPASTSRATFGLPAQAVVLGNFSQHYKFTPEMFGLWCRLLRAAPERLLWLLDPGLAVRPRLLREAYGHGVAPERLVFSPPLSPPDHLARLRA